MSILLALIGLSITPVNLSAPMYPGMENLSTVRHLRCDGGTGSGFIAGDGVIVTALHVAALGGCRDAETGNSYTTYHRDEAHDLAMMVGETPTMTPSILDCQGYTPGKTYIAQGITSFKQEWSLFRRVKTVAMGKVDLEVQGEAVLGIRELSGYIVPGMSGGPVHDALTGAVVGIVNVGYFSRAGHPVGQSYSYELKDTALCKG